MQRREAVRPNTSNSLLGGSNNGLVKWALARNRTRTLQFATGGRYKYYIVSKIITFLKTQFLECRDTKFTLVELLGHIQESQTSEDIMTWLIEEGLPSSSRIRKCAGASNKYTYQPPLTCTSEKSLLKILKTRFQEGAGGILRSLVEDSMPFAYGCISSLLQSNKIFQVTRNDKAQILFFKNPEPELDPYEMDERVVGLFRRVDVANKEMSHLQMYLTKQKKKFFDEETIDKREPPPDQEPEGIEEGSSKRRKRKNKAVPKPPPKRRRPVRKLRDNAHVQDQIDPNLQQFGEEPQ